LKKSQLYSSCHLHDNLALSTINDCMADILFAGTTDFLDTIAESFTSECLQIMARDPANYVSDKDGKNVLKPEFSDDLCPEGCEKHGKCGTKGQCVCDQGWEGEHCHLMTGKGPQLDRIRSGPLCDLTKRPCKRVFIDASNLDLSDDLSCQVELVDEQGQSTGKAVTTEGTLVSSYRIACEIPETVVANQIYEVSATNDGSLFGNSLTLRVFDGSCLECDGAGCKDKKTSCHIGGRCYQNGQSNPTDNLQICDIAQSVNTWTSLATQKPVKFFPTITGPDTDFLMTCSFVPPTDVSGSFKVTWYVDNKELSSETTDNGATHVLKSLTELPNKGDLTCEVEFNGVSSRSSPLDLATVIHVSS